MAEFLGPVRRAAMATAGSRTIVSGVDTLRNPTGPLPASTYWRRRVLLLGVLLVVVALVVWACTRSSGAEQKPTGAAASQSSKLPTVPAETASPTPTATASATPSVTGSDASGSATPSTSESKTKSSPKPSKRNGKTLCPADDLKVTVRTDQKFYSPKEDPKFTVIIVNLRKSSCYVDLGKKAAALTVISGKDRIWSNADCTDRPDEKLKKFASGDVYTSSVTWKRNRTAKGCPDIDATAKPGYYVVDAEVGKAEPDDRPVFVLKEN